LENLKKKSKYYSTITRVYESQPAKFSKIIYPLEELQKAEKNLEESETLDEAIKHFSEIDELREGWVEKATKMNEWHKSMKMFMAGFSPAASLDDRNKFIDDAIRKIKETYSREDISSYLGWALKEIAETMVSKRG
jgi:DNA repair ATPase RecN